MSSSVSTDRTLKVGQTVQILGRNTKGRVAYVGVTNFAAGKWVGVILDEPKGKNNGTIKGYSYFKCADNHGVFVRPSQLIPTVDVVPHNNTPAPAPAHAPAPHSTRSSDYGHVPIAPKTTKLNRTKSFLSSSSQSLLSSPTHSEHLRSKTTVSPSESFGFVETGFLEILRPQFTPGQPMRSPSFSMINNEEQKIVDDLKVEVRDLSQELELIKRQRQDEKRKLQECDKLKIQCEQLLEFKIKIMESHANLQRELQRVRQEARETQEAKSRCLQEFNELSENVELLTLDKEMAEEKADTLQMELDIALERIEELVLDVEILKNENSDSHLSSTEIAIPSSGELKKLQQHNHRLKETVIRLRDVIAQDKQELQKVNKELETKASEITELQKTKVKLSMRIDAMEFQIMDLHEQVDAALGAESMVESLTESKLELEERVKLMEEEVAELEALEEIHEQIIESNHDLEMDLREEIDMLGATNKALLRDKDAALETIYDRDITIIKFRELVKILNEQLTAREKDLEAAADDFVVIPLENEPKIDFTKLFTESKAYSRAIDVQLSQMQLQETRDLSDLLLSFMPDDFKVRGGDYDAIQVQLLLNRFIFKSDIIQNEIREKFPSTVDFDKDSIFEGFSIHRFAFRSRCLYHVSSLQMILHQMIYGLNNCEHETLMRAAIYKAEMLNNEKYIDGIIELLKSGQLDENSSTEDIERCSNFFSVMYSTIIHLDSNDLINEHQLYTDIVETFERGCDSIMTSAGIIQTLIQIGQETTDSYCLLQFLMENLAKFKANLRALRRKLPREHKYEFYAISRDQFNGMRVVNETFGKLLQILHCTSKQAIHEISSMKCEDSSEVSIPHDVLWKMLYSNCSRIYQETDKSPVTNFQFVIDVINEEMSHILQNIQEAEKANLNNAQTKCIRSNPVLIRANQVKQQLEEIKKLTAALEYREAEIKQLKLTSKKKLNELSEMQVRKDMAERNLTKLQHDFDVTIENLKQCIDETQEHIDNRERQCADSISLLEEKISKMESATLELKDHLKSKACTATLDDLNSMQEVSLLKTVLKEERDERIRIQGKELKLALKKLTPISVPQPRDKELERLEKDIKTLKNDWILSYIIDNRKFKTNIKTKSELMAQDILGEYFKRNPHRAAESDFSIFPSIEVTNAFRV
ncbi:dynactin subunit 1-like [Episyrphus balteatus]|uniref:dynactin subunit 1-like n=1 Tax=Episyrphus balteatus TaxID=286459 RepID=UPI0024869BCB|nr:dynactin subunit 1-like [Episyrphus balteatus]